MTKNGRKDRDDETRLNRRVAITEEMRSSLSAWRRARRLSFARMAFLLDVNWSTYRKWELRQTGWYSRKSELNAKSLLEGGDADALIAELNETGRSVPPADTEAGMERRMERLLMLTKAMWRLCRHAPILRERFLRRLEASLDGLIRGMSEGEIS